MSKGFLYVGITLFVLYVGQAVFHFPWEYLASLQQGESYKRWSGLILFLFIAMQWLLTLFRVKPKLDSHSSNVMEIHKWMGALSPLVFYMHSVHFGYAYLFIVSLIFFVNVFLGFVHVDIIKTKAYWYFQGWMITHVALSLALSLLVFYHIWIVFYYQ